MQTKYKAASISAFLALSMGVSNAVAGECSASTSSSVVAIPFDYYVTKDKGRWVTLSATSNDIEWNKLNEGWPKRYKAFKYGGGAAITEWKIDELPANGVLYDGASVVEAGDIIADPDDLYYTPNIGFVGNDPFTYCAKDSSGRSNVATVKMIVADPANYPMPYGISDPGFGIDEEPPGDPSGWPSSEVSGFYYIDSDNPDCSDENDFGYPEVPRCTIEHGARIEAGKKMVLASSVAPYELRNFGFHQTYLLGTADNPAWIVGDERSPVKPKVMKNRSTDLQGWRIEGTGHWRIGGIDLDGANFDNRGSSEDVVLRYSRVRNFPSSRGGGTTVNMSSSNGSDRKQLSFQVNVHDNGIVSPTLAEERDIHAFTVLNNKDYWILDVMCSENAGDCVQLTNNNTSENVYVGRATMHSMMENCTDFKDFNNFVVTESNCWDIRRVSYLSGSGGNAQNFYVNDEGDQQGFGYFLNNRSWDTNGEAFGSANVGGRVYFIGNRGFFSREGVGLSGMNGSGARHYYFNTIYDVKDGMAIYTAGSAQGRYVMGNAIGKASRYCSFVSADFAGISVFDYNAYFDCSSYAWGSNRTPNSGTYAEYKAATQFDQSSPALNASEFGMKSLGKFDFALVSSSSLRDKISRDSLGSLAPGVLDMQRDLGVSFKDFDFTVRSSNSLDIGSDEFISSGVAAPLPPTGVTAEVTD